MSLWTPVPKGSEVWVAESKGNESWSDIPKGTDAWANESKGNEEWTDISKGSDVWDIPVFLLTESQDFLLTEVGQRLILE